MFDRANDTRIRTAAFEWLSSQASLHNDVLPRTALQDGFELDGVRIPLIGPQGIFKPRVLQVPLSVTTSPKSPYNDAFGTDGRLRYSYRGTNPEHPDNRGLREALIRKLPLVYFHGIMPGRYVATWPVRILSDDPANLAFLVEVDARNLGQPSWKDAQFHDGDSVRRYVTADVRVRLHQRAFRERVLAAYQHQCAFCRLRHTELLDAAHIVADSKPEGEPVVSNGLALCSLHHAAFDKMFLGLRPDYTIEVRPDILREHDGPTLKHAIQELQGIRIALPASPRMRPDRELVAVRYKEFARSF